MAFSDAKPRALCIRADLCFYKNQTQDFTGCKKSRGSEPVHCPSQLQLL